MESQSNPDADAAEIGYDDAPLPRRPSFSILRQPPTILPGPAEADSWAHLVRPSAGKKHSLWPALVLPLAAVAALWGWSTFSGELRASGSTPGVTVASQQQTWPAVLVEAEGVDDPLSAYSQDNQEPEAVPSALSIPVPVELADGGLAPGSLSTSYTYADDWRGWPVEPVDGQPPVRGSFLAPRSLEATYHFGIDVSVDDANPHPAAPPGLAHPVFAVESGHVQVAHNGTGFDDPACNDSRFMLGHFEYWHIRPTVALGQYVRAGEQIGWTCLGEWHIHLSEWVEVGGRRLWVNPLHEGGKLGEYEDTLPPVVGTLRFRTAELTPWRPETIQERDTSEMVGKDRLSGRVELRVPVYDQQSTLGFLTDIPSSTSTFFTPYRVAVAVRSEDRDVIFAVDSFRSDYFIERDYLLHYAPGSRKPLSMGRCVKGGVATCGGRFIYRPFSQTSRRFWDTRQVPNGKYIVSVYAWDIKGNLGSRSEVVVVSNGAVGGQGGPPLVAGYVG